MKGPNMIVLLSALLVGSAFAQFRPNLVIPDQISGRFVEFDPSHQKIANKNRTANFFTFGYWQYDKELRRQWFAEDYFEGKNNDREHRFEVLELYDLRAIYVTDVDNEKKPECKLFKMDDNDEFPDLAPPQEAKFHGAGTLGIPPVYGTHPEDLDFVYFSWNSTDSRGVTTDIWSQYTWSGTNRGHDASVGFPLEFHYRAPQYGFIYQQFTDSALGIEDPDAFLPPADCKPAAEGERYTGRRGVGFRNTQG